MFEGEDYYDYYNFYDFYDFYDYYMPLEKCLIS